MRKPISITRLKPRALPVVALRRPRLDNWFTVNQNAKLRLVQAPAGHGKSILLQQHFEYLNKSARKVSWLELSNQEDDLDHILCAITEAIRQERPSFGIGLLGLLDSGWPATPESAATLISNELHAQKEPLTIFLDGSNPPPATTTWELINYLLQQTPAFIKFVIAIRGNVDLDLGHYDAMGNLAVLTASEMVFSADEIRDWISLQAPAVPTQLHQALIDTTRGWPALLQIIYRGMTEAKNPDRYIQTVNGGRGRLKQYFHSDIFVGLPRGAQTLLLCAVPFRRFCRELCNTVLENQLGDNIDEVISTYGIPTARSEEAMEWHRFHPVFHQFLNTLYSSPTGSNNANLHRRASNWFHTHNFIEEAVEHAFIAGDSEHAAELLATHAEEFIEQGRVEIFLHLVTRVPAEVARQYPHMRLKVVWALTLLLRFAEAKNVLADVKKYHLANQSSLASDKLEPHLLRREMTIELLSDNLPQSAALARHLLDEHPPDSPILRREIEMEQFYASQNLFDCSGLADAEARAAIVQSDKTQSFVSIWTSCVVANAERMRGSFSAAEALCKDAIDIANRHENTQQRDSLAAMPRALWASMLLEQNQLSTAQSLLQLARPYFDDMGLLDAAAQGYLCLTRLHASRQQFTEVDALLQQAASLAGRRNYPRLRNQVTAARIRISLIRGRQEEAVRLARGDQLTGPLASQLPTATPTTGDLVRAQIWARLATTHGNAANAKKLLRVWLKLVKNATFDLFAVQLLAQLSTTLVVLGEQRAALRHIRNALELAMPCGLIRIFIDEGEPCRQLLQTISDFGREQTDAVAAYANFLLGIFEQELPMHPSLRLPDEESTAGMVEPLTARQVEILRLVSSGLSNKEISGDLGLSEGSVKWHLHNAYGRLGVRRRSHAVRRALQLGFLNAP